MRVDLFDFELPSARIALRPASPRDSARLLCVKPGATLPFSDYHMSDLPHLLQQGDALVFNNTKVFPAQLSGVRRRGENATAVTLNLHKRVDERTWLAFARPAKRLKAGDLIEFEDFSADVLARNEAEVVLQFSLRGAALDQAIAKAGVTPLPPYIALKRAADERDVLDYQTLFAAHKGSVAAPTAGLHFTEHLFAALGERGISCHFVTLHVGAGTFLPVKSENTEDHVMHAEWGVISKDTARALNEVRNKGGRIIPVGTTSLRLLESASDERGLIKPFAGETSIFITPGYKFRVADLLLTNFHLPRSTLFMLACAFSGLETMQSAYRHAIENKYRFYSYGDACLLYPEGRS
jgi:S-adenosylmethionine:tRNA ribosyltransferase-isomerase